MICGLILLVAALVASALTQNDINQVPAEFEDFARGQGYETTTMYEVTYEWDQGNSTRELVHELTAAELLEKQGGLSGENPEFKLPSDAFEDGKKSVIAEVPGNTGFGDKTVTVVEYVNSPAEQMEYESTGSAKEAFENAKATAKANHIMWPWIFGGLAILCSVPSLGYCFVRCCKWITNSWWKTRREEMREIESRQCGNELAEMLQGLTNSKGEPLRGGFSDTLIGEKMQGDQRARMKEMHEEEKDAERQRQIRNQNTLESLLSKAKRDGDDFNIPIFKAMLRQHHSQYDTGNKVRRRLAVLERMIDLSL